jgi:hypothetical protein
LTFLLGMSYCLCPSSFIYLFFYFNCFILVLKSGPVESSWSLIFDYETVLLRGIVFNFLYFIRFDNFYSCSSTILLILPIIIDCF